ncbi:MAG: VCBS repeat-containing protein [Desulfobacterales bacterium]|nr:MAG: VCBS repeat-containing protein [Desulfobacterales bacterium]
MKTNGYKTSRLVFLAFLLAVTLGVNFATAAAEVKRVAIVPFKIHAEKDLSFLRDGVYDMLSSRLSKEGEVQVLSRTETEKASAAVIGAGAVNETLAREVGKKLNADFVLFGSLTVFGNSVSIDSKMVDVAGGGPTLSLFNQSPKLDDVIPSIDQFAADINAQLFGRETTAAKAPVPSPAAPPAQADIHAHPEKLLKEGGFRDQTAEGSPDSPFILTRKPGESAPQFWKSANFSHLINGLSVGDVDGDGKIETVVIAPQATLIYRREAGRFFKVQEIAADSQKHFIGVDVADINANGYAEIFVTSLNAHKNSLNSFVLEYDGHQFTKIMDDAAWFYRVIDHPARGKVLLGQRHQRGDPFGGEIFEMSWQNSQYVSESPLKTPRHINLLGLAFGDVLHNGQETAVAYKDNDRIEVFDATGQVLWDGSERYGGSMLYYAGPKTDLGEVENRLYLPMRLLVWKNAANTETAVIAAKNHDLSNMKLELRKFTNAHFEALTWDGLGLVPNWQTRKISGYIRDFAIGDFDNDGGDELIAAVVQKEGRIVLTEPKSAIIAYELNL